MFKRKFFAFLFFELFAGKVLLSQIEPQFTQFDFNQQLINSAYVGSNELIEVNALYRDQYLKLTPQVLSTQYIGFNMPVCKINSGIGFSVVNDLIGYQRISYLTLDYAYRSRFKFGSIAFGVGLGAIQSSLQGDKLRTPGGVYENGINHKDPLIPTTTVNGIIPDLSVSFYLNNPKYFIGVSVTHLLGLPLEFKTTNSSLQVARNLLIMGGYEFKISRKVNLRTALLLKTEFKQVQLDFSNVFLLRNNFLIGFSLRGYSKFSIDGLNLFAGFRIKRGLQILYSYDINLSSLNHFNNGSHEISLKYGISYRGGVSKEYYYYNPRFF